MLTCLQVQEAGLSFYSYQILLRVLQGVRRRLFLIVFWTMIAIISSIRLAILICRIRVVLDGSDRVQDIIDNLHVGYFVSIGLVESFSSGLLLELLYNAHRLNSCEIQKPTSIFRHLLRTTEMRLATLALIGIMRATTYAFQRAAQGATTVASQLDRFVYSLECLFPFVMLYDSNIIGSSRASEISVVQQLILLLSPII